MKLPTWKQIDHEMNSLGNEQLLLNTVQTLEQVIHWTDVVR